MGQRSKIKQLPAAVREWLDMALAANNFAGYEQLEEELRERGYSVGKSSIHRYGSNLEKKLGAIKASTEAARMIANSAPDDADERSGAVISMLQTEIFEMLVGLQEAEGAADPMARAKILSALAKNVATFTRASIGQKKHAIEFRAKAMAAADAAEKIGKKGGLSSSAVDEIRREILGIAA